MSLFGITFVMDRIALHIGGVAPQRFLSLAAQHNLRLWRIRCVADGYIAHARGVDLAALSKLAADGDWQITLLKRSGPGSWTAGALRRPGVPVGVVLFMLLLHFLSSFVWYVDFGALEAEEQTALRALLASNGIYEGTRPSPDALTAVRREIAAQTDRYGWINVNFTDGCLSIESSPSRFESVTPPIPDVALYAAAEGEVLRVETESGFSLVAPGQYVAEGQLLVDRLRTRRSGTAFAQGASGAVIARIVRSYTATQPASVTTTVPSGLRIESIALHFMGQKKVLQGNPDSVSDAAMVEWLPLQIGRVALPGCLYRTTLWPRQNIALHYTAAQTAALAARACRRQLMAEFPDAVIQTQQRDEETTEQGTRCTLRYTFCANIARPK